MRKNKRCLKVSRGYHFFADQYSIFDPYQTGFHPHAYHVLPEIPLPPTASFLAQASKAERKCRCKTVLFFIFPSIPSRISVPCLRIELCYSPICSPPDVRESGKNVCSKWKWECHRSHDWTDGLCLNRCHDAPKSRFISWGQEKPVLSEGWQRATICSGLNVSFKKVCPSPNLL